ncbi:hypothetical protein PYCC9005_000125 [Savitreella phatthalungensis]
MMQLSLLLLALVTTGVAECRPKAASSGLRDLSAMSTSESSPLPSSSPSLTISPSILALKPSSNPGVSPSISTPSPSAISLPLVANSSTAVTPASTTTGTNSGDQKLSAGCGKGIGSGPAKGKTTAHVTVDSVDRMFIVEPPTTYDSSKPSKLLFLYHYWSGSAEGMAKDWIGMKALDTTNRFIYVAPQGIDKQWRNDHGSDVKFFDAMVSQIGEEYCIDLSGIWSTGLSFGAFMSHVLACERGGEVGGVEGVVVWSGAERVLSAANYTGTCNKQVAYFATHGTSDTTIPYDEGLTALLHVAKADACKVDTPKAPANGSKTYIVTDLDGCSKPVEWVSYDGDHGRYFGEKAGARVPMHVDLAWKFITRFL